ncbi:MAG: alpha/beta hydrolase [Candidatus Rokubacteria bacterium]|nr:alpha/beta hydrolase [Candidatus Rokubacteria bacterium]
MTLTTADGERLEARIARPAAVRGGLVACHPHPLYGGDMDNPVVIRAVEVASAHGLATLRFNFRGVGASGGEHGGGIRERRDVSAAIDHLAACVPRNAPLVLCGYSFGAAVVAHVVAEHPVAGLAMIAPPLGIAELARLPAWPEAVSVLVVAGSHDEYCPRAALDRLASERPRARVRVIEGANHFFFGKLYPLGAALDAWLGDLLGTPEPASGA